MAHGIENLIAPYFERVCREVFEDTLRGEGFDQTEVTRVGGVRFYKGDVFVEITYRP